MNKSSLYWLQRTSRTGKGGRIIDFGFCEKFKGDLKFMSKMLKAASF